MSIMESGQASRQYCLDRASEAMEVFKTKETCLGTPQLGAGGGGGGSVH